MSAYPESASPFIGSIILTVMGMFIGAGVGWAIGIHSFPSLAEALQHSETNCGTGLVFLLFGYALLGMLVGAMPGIIIALIIQQRRRPRGKSDWAAYYGN